MKEDSVKVEEISDSLDSVVEQLIQGMKKVAQSAGLDENNPEHCRIILETFNSIMKAHLPNDRAIEHKDE